MGLGDQVGMGLFTRVDCDVVYPHIAHAMYVADFRYA
jgi:hypothetical protein